jgi:hypothetical protein
MQRLRSVSVEQLQMTMLLVVVELAVQRPTAEISAGRAKPPDRDHGVVRAVYRTNRVQRKARARIRLCDED